MSTFAKINAICGKNVLLNVGQGKTLAVPSSKLSPDVEKGGIVEFEGVLGEMSYIDRTTGDVVTSKYLAAQAFKEISYKQPSTIVEFTPLQSAAVEETISEPFPEAKAKGK